MELIKLVVDLGIATGYKIGTIADVEHPPHCGHKDSNGSLVHARHILRSDENIAENQYGDDEQCHKQKLKSFRKVTKLYETCKFSSVFLL